MLRIVLALCIFAFASPVRPGTLEDAGAAYDRQDYATASRLYRSLADQGNAAAQAILALMYYHGQGVVQSYTEAANLNRLAAIQGHAVAQANLALSYNEGWGVPQSYTGAAKWWRLAADQGYTDAQYNLATSYARGQGVPRNFVRSYMWYSLAAAQGSQPAAQNLDKIGRFMTPAQVAEAQNLAAEWRPKTANASPEPKSPSPLHRQEQPFSSQPRATH